MPDEHARGFGRLRNPEYTGDNRCLPCTVVNLFLAVVLAVLVALVTPLLGAVILFASVATIYLRGYLVPGTPVLTERYLPDWILALFEKESPGPRERAGSRVSSPDGGETGVGVQSTEADTTRDGASASAGADTVDNDGGSAADRTGSVTVDGGAGTISVDAGPSGTPTTARPKAAADREGGTDRTGSDSTANRTDTGGDSRADSTETTSTTDDTDGASSDSGAPWDAIEKHRRAKANRVDAGPYLVNVGAVGGTDGEGFTDEFAASLADHLPPAGTVWEEPTPTGREAVAALFNTDSDGIKIKDRTYPSFRVGARVRSWPSESALRADIAAHRALVEATDDWLEVPEDQRIDILTALRALRTTCPCGGSLTENSTLVDSCCRSGEVIALSCGECDETLLERDPATTAWLSLTEV